MSVYLPVLETVDDEQILVPKETIPLIRNKRSGFKFSPNGNIMATRSSYEPVSILNAFTLNEFKDVVKSYDITNYIESITVGFEIWTVIFRGSDYDVQYVIEESSDIHKLDEYGSIDFSKNNIITYSTTSTVNKGFYFVCKDPFVINWKEPMNKNFDAFRSDWYGKDYYGGSNLLHVLTQSEFGEVPFSIKERITQQHSDAYSNTYAWSIAWKPGEHILNGVRNGSASRTYNKNDIRVLLGMDNSSDYSRWYCTVGAAKASGSGNISGSFEFELTLKGKRIPVHYMLTRDIHE